VADLETTFLIDLERELRRGKDGPAQRFLANRAEDRLHLTFTIVGELAAGASMADREVWQEFVAPFRVLESNPEVSWRYGEIYRHLQDSGLLIGSNDLWIAATALAQDMAVVTGNERHFRRVPDLTVLSHLRPAA
jgi:tRNA(fMet)-specific endonuclease VapC